MPITTTYMTIPITKPLFGDDEERAVIEVLRSGWIVQGPKVAAFERLVADYVGVPEAVAGAIGPDGGLGRGRAARCAEEHQT